MYHKCLTLAGISGKINSDNFIMPHMYCNYLLYIQIIMHIIMHKWPGICFWQVGRMGAGGQGLPMWEPVFTFKMATNEDRAEAAELSWPHSLTPGFIWFDHVHSCYNHRISWWIAQHSLFYCPCVWQSQSFNDTKLLKHCTVTHHRLRKAPVRPNFVKNN